jgi:hypothetical protein
MSHVHYSTSTTRIHLLYCSVLLANSGTVVFSVGTHFARTVRHYFIRTVLYVVQYSSIKILYCTVIF